jgi:hypothetical protein
MTMLLVETANHMMLRQRTQRVTDFLFVGLAALGLLVGTIGTAITLL